MSTTKDKFVVILFTRLPENENEECHCVPISWIKCYHDEKQITVAYPKDMTAQIQKLLSNGKPPEDKWPLYPALLMEGFVRYIDALHVMISERQKQKQENVDNHSENIHDLDDVSIVTNAEANISSQSEEAENLSSLQKEPKKPGKRPHSDDSINRKSSSRKQDSSTSTVNNESHEVNKLTSTSGKLQKASTLSDSRCRIEDHGQVSNEIKHSLPKENTEKYKIPRKPTDDIAKPTSPKNNTESLRLKEEQSSEQRIQERHKYGGTGKAQNQPSCKFRAADSTVALFINNVHRDTTEKDITDYIYDNTKEHVTLTRIPSKKNSIYKSYKLWVPTQKSHIFYNEYLWPEGIKFRPFTDHRFDPRNSRY